MSRRTTLVFTRLLFTGLAILSPTFATPAEARPQWLTAFVGEYPTATQLFSCGACHRNFNGPTDDLVALIVGAESEGGFNPYGNAFKEHDGEDHPASALAAIENLDSDGDGTSNIDEILTGAGFTPGYDCDNYQTAVNAPANLPAYVDPEDPGCGVVTTTLPPTTLPPTTSSSTTSTSTTTSLAASTTTSTTSPVEGCGAPVSGSSPPTATDCLFILHAAVGLDACNPECLCAPKGSLPVSATDALACLRAAVGESVPLDCACGGTSTSTSTSTSTTTSTSTSTSTSSSSSTTSSSTTTTTVVNPVTSGRAVYDARCASCHKAGSHDTSGFASDLRTKSGLLVSNLGSIDPIMSGITLTQKEIDDLTAFLDSL